MLTGRRLQGFRTLLGKIGKKQKQASAVCKKTQVGVTDVEPKTWEAFRMTHVDGLSISDAAKLLGVGVGQVYVARSRVMKRLQNLVNHYRHYSVVTDDLCSNL